MKSVRSVLFLSVALVLLGGCANIGYIMDTYGTMQPEQFRHNGKMYRIFDLPDEGKIMVTPSIGNAFAIGIAEGVTLNSVNATPAKVIFQRVIEDYLEQSGRECEVLDGYILADPQWEFVYKTKGSG